MERKPDIRARILKLRDTLSDSDRKKYGERIFKQVAALEAYRNAEHILCFASFGSEVPTGSFMQRALKEEKAVYCPKVLGRQMEFYKITSLSELHLSAKFRIPEPEALEKNQFHQVLPGNSLVIMPGAVFDRKRHRIGYGGGYYDRYLAAHLNTATVAVCYSMQMVDEIPFEKHDILPDCLVTEHGIF